MRVRWRHSFVALGLCWIAGCGQEGEPVDVPSWESFLAESTKEFEGKTIYVIEGDIPVTLDGLRAEYDRLVAEALGETAGGEELGSAHQPSLVNQVGGVDDLWPQLDRRDLTYCVSNEFGALKTRTVNEMAQATREWESHANVNFRYVPGEDGVCNNTNTNIVFSVRPWSSGGACAFFPSGDACIARTLVINHSSYTTGIKTSQGVLRHELGHILGLRHEHIRVPGTSCNTEDSSWRPVTTYDSNSVMHYHSCTGSTNTGDYRITALDAQGVKSLYGPGSAHGFAWVTAAGAVSPVYSFNSEGGAVTASVAGTGPSTVYTVTFAGLGGMGGNVQAVAYGASNARCQVVGWGGVWPGALSATVKCHTPAGTGVASAFVVQYARKATFVDGTGGFMWVHNPTTPGACPATDYDLNTGVYSWNSTDGVNCFTRAGAGVYDVHFPGLGVVGGTYQVSAYGSTGEHCKIQSWGPSGGAEVARVLCFSAAGAPVDTRFSINFFGNAEVSAYDEGGYAWASNITSPSYTPSPTYAYNSGDIAGWPGCGGWLGSIEAGKVGAIAGRYFLRYEWLSPTGSAPHATAYGASSAYCKLEGWFSWTTGVEVQTACYSADGTRQDNQYVGTYATRYTRGPC
jgi:hypothetical protein